ncbi:MAG: hypothetical protein J0M33_15180 [Anaerolineae bacterium]|nr:hypothetical protein [Anaerolineae bacterium]
MSNIRILPIHPDHQRSSAEKPVSNLIVSLSPFDLGLAYRALIRAFLNLPDRKDTYVGSNERDSQ